MLAKKTTKNLRGKKRGPLYIRDKEVCLSDPTSIAMRVESVAKAAETAYSLGKNAMALLNTEVKYHEVSGSVNPSSASWSAIHLNSIAQGDGGSTRDGDSIRIKKLEFRLTFTQNAAASNTGVRLVLCRIPHVGAIDVSVSAFDNPTLDSFRSHDYMRSWNLVDDNVVLLTSGSQPYFFQSKQLAVNWRCTYAPAAITVRTNDLYLICCSTEAANTPTLDYNIRTHFIDN